MDPPENLLPLENWREHADDLSSDGSSVESEASDNTCTEMEFDRMQDLLENDLTDDDSDVEPDELKGLMSDLLLSPHKLPPVQSYIDHQAVETLRDDSTDSGEDDSPEGKSIEPMTMTLESSQGTTSPKRKSMTMTLESSQGTTSPKRRRDATSSGSPVNQFQTCLETQTVLRVTHRVVHKPGRLET